MNTVWRVITRKKILDPISTAETRLARVLNTFDLTALGVGSTLGVGVYVLAGHVAKDIAGPAVILSFLIAAIASVFAGLCYAEFGARAPRAGSAYIYSYVCVGELIAFIIGWNLILEYIIGSASVARGLSLYLDTLLNNTLKETFIEIAPINVSFMAQYFDFFAFSIAMLLSVALAFGMKESTFINNIFTILNIFVVIFVVIVGSMNANFDNWSLPANSTIDHSGSGGFFPFGVEGMIKGAATCFYGFVGFDCIATTGEEVKNPQKALPRSIILSLIIIFLAYFGTSTVVTLMLPYYAQDPDAPIPHAFDEIGLYVAKWVVAIGGIFGLFASLFGAMFPLPRIIYAMASDGLVFRFLGNVNSYFQTPIVGTLLAGLLTGLMAAMFDLKQLVNMMSIGTLLAYTIVAACVLLLRYRTDQEPNYTLLRTDDADIDSYTDTRTLNYDALTNAEQSNTDDGDLETIEQEVTCWNIFKQIFNCSGFQNPTKLSEKLVTTEVFIYCTLCLLLGLCAMYLVDPISHGKIWAITLVSIVGCLMIIVLMSLATQPTSKRVISFKVHPVPLIPALSILVNIYLMLMLDDNTWIRFGVWMAIGLPVYYFSVRYYPKTAQNHSVSTSKILISENSKQNGYINNGFISDLDKNGAIKNNDDINTVNSVTLINENGIKSGSNGIVETNTANNQAESNSLENALGMLDEVNRKFSLETASNASNFLCEQNVIALVHCEDIKSAPETPQTENVELLGEIPNQNIKINNEDAESTPIENPSSYEETEMKNTENVPGAIDSPQIENAELLGEIPNQNIKIDNKDAESTPIENPSSSEETQMKNTENVPGATHSPQIENIDENTTEDAQVDETTSTPEVLVTTEPTNDDSSDDKLKTNPETEDDISVNTAPVPPPLPLLKLNEGVTKIPRLVSSRRLKAVELKPVRTKSSSPPIDYSDDESNDNIKVKSDEAARFKGRLENIFKTTLPPQVAMRRHTSHLTKDIKDVPVSKDSVIEDSLNTEEARINLKNFLESNRNKPFNPPMENEEDVEKPTRNPRELRKSISSSNICQDDKYDILNHRQRMADNLRSIRLRKVDSFKTD